MDTHFGGSLYAMCDPFFALILIEQLGREYDVWDKSAQIEFHRRGRGLVAATFAINESEVAETRETADGGEPAEPVFVAEVKDQSDATVAQVTKTIHVRRRPG